MSEGVVKFQSCWVDDEPTRKVMTIDGITFTMRGITVGEHARIMSESRVMEPTAVRDVDPAFVAEWAKTLGKTVSELTNDERNAANAAATRVSASSEINIYKLMTLTVGAALGMWQSFGGEGWSANRDVTPESINLLRKEVVDALYNAHQSAFRGE